MRIYIREGKGPDNNEGKELLPKETNHGFLGAGAWPGTGESGP